MKVKLNPTIENSVTYEDETRERAILFFHAVLQVLAMVHYADGDDLQMAFDRIKRENIPEQVKESVKELINAVIDHGIGVEE